MMNQSFFDRIPTDLTGGFFVYKATGAEELCFADRNVLELYGCGTMEEFRAHTGNSFRGMVHPEDLDRVEGEIAAQTFESGERHDYVYYRILTKQGVVRYAEDFGHLVFDKAGESFFYVFIGDVTPSDYQKLNQTDWETRVGYRQSGGRNALTGLMYEKAFIAACEKNLSDPQVNWLMLAIDLQHFKLFNEWYGRDKGDCVLADIGHELSRIAEAHSGIAGYLGGDDFSILVPAGHFDSDILFERIHSIIIKHGASVGFLPAIGASYSHGTVSAYTLYDQASLASHEAKGDPKVRVKFFSQAMINQTERDYRVLSEFEDALANDEITFYLQPQCRSDSGRIVGAEALARWIRPDGQIISPVNFVPALEQYGFVPDLDKRIWEEVCKWIRKMMDEGNLSCPFR